MKPLNKRCFEGLKTFLSKKYLFYIQKHYSKFMRYNFKKRSSDFCLWTVRYRAPFFCLYLNQNNVDMIPCIDATFISLKIVNLFPNEKI